MQEGSDTKENALYLKPWTLKISAKLSVISKHLNQSSTECFFSSTMSLHWDETRQRKWVSSETLTLTVNGGRILSRVGGPRWAL